LRTAFCDKALDLLPRPQLTRTNTGLRLRKLARNPPAPELTFAYAELFADLPQTHEFHCHALIPRKTGRTILRPYPSGGTEGDRKEKLIASRCFQSDFFF
jgi:hypothetical protein